MAGRAYAGLHELSRPEWDGVKGELLAHALTPIATDRWLPMAMSTRARTNSPGSTVFWPQWAARIFSVIVRPRTGPMLCDYLRPNDAGRNVERPGHWATMNNESSIASTNGQTAREISSKDSLAMLAAT